MITTETIIEILEYSDTVEYHFTDLLFKSSPHSVPVMIHRIFKDEIDNQWTVVLGAQKSMYLLKEITNEQTLATIYQRLRLMQKK